MDPLAKKKRKRPTTVEDITEPREKRVKTERRYRDELSDEDFLDEAHSEKETETSTQASSSSSSKDQRTVRSTTRDFTLERRAERDRLNREKEKKRASPSSHIASLLLLTLFASPKLSISPLIMGLTLPSPSSTHRRREQNENLCRKYGT